MSTVTDTTPRSAEQDWKQRYRELTREIDQERATWAQSERTLLQAVLKFTQCFDGLDAGLDRQLGSLRGRLRAEGAAKIRPDLLNEIGDACLAQSRKRAHPSADADRSPLEVLLAALKVPPQTAFEFKQIQSRLKNGDDPARLAALLAEILNDLAAAPPRSDAPALSVVADLVPEVLDELAAHDALRARAVELRTCWEQEAGSAARRALGTRLVQLLRDALAMSVASATDANSGSAASLARLLGWLLLPSEFEERSLQLRETLSRGESQDPVRDTSGFLNDLHAFMRKDLRTLEGYLQQTSETLRTIDGELRYALDHSRTTAQESNELTRGISAHMDALDAELQEGGPTSDLRSLVERRVATIRSTMSAFLSVQQHKQDLYEQRIADLTRRLQNFEQESNSLRATLEAEHARAYVDALTGAPNRLAYEERAQLEVKRASRHGLPLCLAVLDLDRFKDINDSFGHRAGDKLLRYIASLALQRIRATDLFARYGGEEFVALFTDTRLADALEVCEDLRRQIADSNFHFKGAPVPVTVSIGVAQLGAQEGLGAFFERADGALYRAKRGGRNRVEAAN